MNKMQKFMCGVGMMMELGSIIGLTAIALKRNNDCYKAECEAIKLQSTVILKEIDLITKNAQIRVLEKEVEELKNKYESEEVEEA